MISIIIYYTCDNNVVLPEPVGPVNTVNSPLLNPFNVELIIGNVSLLTPWISSLWRIS